MGGSAVIGDSLVDQFIGLADELRASAAADFGTRQWNVYAVVRRWVDGTVGEGTFVDEETLLEPPPKIESFSSLANRLTPCGIDEAGILRMTQVSLSYTEAELGGGVRDHDAQHYFKVVDAHGQATTTRYFANRVPPYPDRIRTIGWVLEVEDAKVAAAVDPAAPAEGDDMSVAPGSTLAKDLGDLAVDGSTTDQTFDYIVPAGKKAVIQKITVGVRCATAPVGDGFGDLAELEDGLLLEFLDTDLSVLLDLAGGVPVALNEGWAMLAGSDVDIDSVLFQVRATITLPAPVELEAAQRFRVTVQDDLSGLDEFRIQLRGYLVND